MPVKATKNKKITGDSIEELTAILQDSSELPPGNPEKISALDRIKARGKSKQDKTATSPSLSDDEEKAEKKSKAKTAASTKKTTGKTEKKEAPSDTKAATLKKTSKKKEEKKEEPEVAQELTVSPSKKSTKKTVKSKNVKEKADLKEEKSSEASKTVKTSKKTKTVLTDNIKELLEEKMETTTSKKKSRAIKKKEEEPSQEKRQVESVDAEDGTEIGIQPKKRPSRQKKADITLGELLEQAKEEPRDGKDSTKRLKNISETIRADSSKRKKRKNDAALVMATMTGNQDPLSSYEADENVPVVSGFPIDVSGIDFEKERYEAEQECIEDFKVIVDDLEKSCETVKLNYNRAKDSMIEDLYNSDKDAQLQMKELKMKQNDLVNRIAEIQEVILVKKSELDALGFTAFYKKNKIRQIIGESEAEISGLELEALSYNSKLLSIVDAAAAERDELFQALEEGKNKYLEAQGRLKEAQQVLKEMEAREQIDENAVQKKLILKALRMYPKPITIGQLLYYPGLSGYSVQRMSAAINQLVQDELVLKVALEDNVYYLIADNDRK